MEKSEILGMLVIDSFGETAAGLQALSRSASEEIQINKGKDPIATSDKAIIQTLNKIYEGLKEDVFDSETKNIIENTRKILDLKSLALKMKASKISPAKLASVQFSVFIGLTSGCSVGTMAIR